MNKEQLLDETLMKEIKELFQDNLEALDFMLLYNDYGHHVDDIIDENGGFREVLKMSSMAACLWSMPFWKKYGDQLILVEQLINNQYADSVEWESSEDKWMQDDARCLSHAGYNMMFAIILMLKGYDTLRKVSSRWRERAHLKHLPGKPDVKFENLAKAQYDITKQCTGCHQEKPIYYCDTNGSFLCVDCYAITSIRDLFDSRINPLNHEQSK